MLLMLLLILMTIEVVLMSTVGLGPDDLAAQIPDLHIMTVNLLGQFTESPIRLIGALLYFGQRAMQRSYSWLVCRTSHPHRLIGQRRH